MGATGFGGGTQRFRQRQQMGICLLMLLCAWLVGGAVRTAPAGSGPLLILISLDGFRWDYLEKTATPNLHRLIARGVRARALIPSFPTVTFPNHYTIVTGLYPGHHGVVGNDMLDVKSGRRFAISNRAEVGDSMWWRDGVPLWVTVERAGKHAGTMFWPGSEAAIGGVRPSRWVAYDEAMSDLARVDQLLRWLDLPVAERPAFLTLYFGDADKAGHSQGPDSDAVRRAIEQLDGYIGRLLAGLESRGLADRANIVVVSDHGMATVVPDRVLRLDQFISLSDVDVVEINPVLALIPAAGKTEAVYRALVAASPHLHLYRREDTPPEWHFRQHPRIPPLVGVVDEGWRIVKGDLLERAVRAIAPARGAHGYAPSVESMRGIFIAAGPAFRVGVTVPAFENVHVYDALATTLGVTPEKNDGDMAVARTLLR
jgi:predicted AlkP superfamily pyrophosphatase or phosphodiesterase